MHSTISDILSVNDTNIVHYDIELIKQKALEQKRGLNTCNVDKSLLHGQEPEEGTIFGQIHRD